MKRYLRYCLFGLLALVITGCAVDEPLPLPDDWQEGTTLDILIPSTSLARRSGMTRAENDFAHSDAATTAADEGKIHKLTVIAFYNSNDDGERHHFIREVNPEEGVATQNVYVKYAFYVDPGDYDIYLLGNINLGGSILNELKSDLQTDSESEKDLEKRVKKLAHTYIDSDIDSDGKYKKPTTTEGGLPMACHVAKSVKEFKSNPVTANMEFLCAKVRLTVIYDNAFGSGFQIAGLNGKNLYPASFLYPDLKTSDETWIFADEKYKSPVESEGVAAVSGHYSLSKDLAEASLSELAKIPESGTDPLDNLGNELETLPAVRFAWQAVAYLPEYRGKSEADATSLIVKGAEYHDFEIKLGCGSNTTDHGQNQSGPDLERGHYYDIVAKVAESGEVTFAWDFMEWTPENLSVQLSGNTELYVGQTEVEEMTGEDIVEIAYTTTAPRLTFESDKVTVNGREISFFQLKQNATNGTIEVAVNPNVDNGIYNNKGFWVIAGAIKKRIVVKEVKVEPFLRLLPSNQVVYISQIANESGFDIYFEYATNQEDLNLSIESVTNNNEKKDRFTLEICNVEDSVAVSSVMTPIVIGGMFDKMSAQEGKSIDKKNGLIRFHITEPTDHECFSKEIQVKMKATASSGDLSKDATLRIIPNALKYTIHFKAIKDGEILSISDKGWKEPHVYVYQPLEYEDQVSHVKYQVYGCPSGDNQEHTNWLEYSFTGKLAFLGWNYDGGSVSPYTTTVTVSDTDKGNGIKIGGNQYVTGINYGNATGWGNPGNPASFPGTHYKEIDLISEHRKNVTCDKCKNNDYKKLWPGVAMIEESDGWWKVEIPMLAKPGKALVMFAATHDHDGKDENRYPFSNRPGIPLPNYADCEAWYLLDESIGGENCSFSDDRRDEYPAPPVVPGITETVVIRAPQNTSDSGIRTHLYMWKDSGNNHLGGFPGTEGKLNSDKSYRYWEFSITHPENVGIDAYFEDFIFSNGSSDNQTNTISWSGHHTEVTDVAIKAQYGNPDHLYTIWTTGSSEPVAAKTYEIVFRAPKIMLDKNNVTRNCLHMWYYGGSTIFDSKKCDGESNDDGYRYWYLDESKSLENVKFLFKNDSDWSTKLGANNKINQNETDIDFNSTYAVEETDQALKTKYNAKKLYTITSGKQAYLIAWTDRTKPCIYMWGLANDVTGNWNSGNNYDIDAYDSDYSYYWKIVQRNKFKDNYLGINQDYYFKLHNYNENPSEEYKFNGSGYEREFKDLDQNIINNSKLDEYTIIKAFKIIYYNKK